MDYESIKKAYESALPMWWLSAEAGEAFDWLLKRVGELQGKKVVDRCTYCLKELNADHPANMSLDGVGSEEMCGPHEINSVFRLARAILHERNRVRAELESAQQFIADAATNHIELCKQLGTHRPIKGMGCFGSAECINCFKVGFAVMDHAQRRTKQLTDEMVEKNELIIQYRVRLTDISDNLEREKESHQKTAEKLVDTQAILGPLDRRVAMALDPVREWYEGGGHQDDDIVMLREAIADFQSDRKDFMILAAEYKRLWEWREEKDETL